MESVRTDGNAGMSIVTGMHRSGTSLAARILGELGSDLGGRSEMLATDGWNAGGYFENLQLMLLNDRIVLGDTVYFDRFRTEVSSAPRLGARAVMVLSKLRYLFLHSGRGVRRRAEAKAAQIAALARENRGKTVKDPRFSLTLESWRRNGHVEKILYCFRNPVAVARSLKRRDRLPLRVGLRLWRVHVEEFLDSAGGMPVLFLDYDAFFDPVRGSEEIARCFRFAGRAVDPDLVQRIRDTVVTTAWRHYTGTNDARSGRYSDLLAELRHYHTADEFPVPFHRGGR